MDSRDPRNGRSSAGLLGGSALPAELFISGNLCTAGCTEWHVMSIGCESLIFFLFGILLKVEKY
jgi:hypothetical protein